MHHRLQVARRSEQPDDISHCPSPSSPGCDSPLRPVSPRSGRSLTISHSWLSDRPTVRAAGARPQGNLALLTNGPVNTNAQKPHLRRRREGREETCLAPPTEDTAHDHLGRRKKRLLRARQQLGQGGASPRHLPPASSWGLARGSPLDRTSGPAVSSPSAPATRILPEKHAASPCPRSAAPGEWSLAPGHDAYATSVSGSRGCGVTSRRRKTKGEGRARNAQPSDREAAARNPIAQVVAVALSPDQLSFISYRASFINATASEADAQEKPADTRGLAPAAAWGIAGVSGRVPASKGGR